MIATIRRTFTLAASHRLPHVPKGHKCGRMHGHTFRVTVRVRGTVQPSGPEAGMVCDFARIDALRDELDHTTLNDHAGLENPTSELLAWWFVARLLADRVPVLDVIVEEEVGKSRVTVTAADVAGAP